MTEMGLSWATSAFITSDGPKSPAIPATKPQSHH